MRPYIPSAWQLCRYDRNAFLRGNGQPVRVAGAQDVLHELLCPVGVRIAGDRPGADLSKMRRPGAALALDARDHARVPDQEAWIVLAFGAAGLGVVPQTRQFIEHEGRPNGHRRLACKVGAPDGTDVLNA